jgi:hypothetical protein
VAKRKSDPYFAEHASWLKIRNREQIVIHLEPHPLGDLLLRVVAACLVESVSALGSPQHA